MCVCRWKFLHAGSPLDKSVQVACYEHDSFPIGVMLLPDTDQQAL